MSVSYSAREAETDHSNTFVLFSPSSYYNEIILSKMASLDPSAAYDICCERYTINSVGGTVYILYTYCVTVACLQFWSFKYGAYSHLFDLSEFSAILVAFPITHICLVSSAQEGQFIKQQLGKFYYRNLPLQQNFPYVKPCYLTENSKSEEHNLY